MHRSLASLLCFLSLASSLLACNRQADHAVLCTQAKIRRVRADKGTPNDRQQRCHGMLQARMQAQPTADHAAYADCVLDAETQAAADQCK